MYQRLELCTRELDHQVLGTCGISSDVRQVHFCLLRAGQLDLGLFCRFLQTLQRQWIVVQIDAVFILELIREELDQTQVEVFSTKEGIAVGSKYFELMLAINFCNFNNRDIKRTATQVIDRNSAITLSFVHAVGQCSRGWLVNDSLHLETRNATRVLGCLTLRIVEVSRYGDHRFRDRLAEVFFGRLLHLAKHFC